MSATTRGRFFRRLLERRAVSRELTEIITGRRLYPDPQVVYAAPPSWEGELANALASCEQDDAQAGEPDAR